MSCRKSGRRHHRHAAVNQIIKRALDAAKIPAQIEQNGLSRSDGKRPDCATVMPWSHGQLLVWYATCPDTLALSYRLHACSGPVEVATAIEHRKTSKYAHLGPSLPLCTSIAIETMGAYGQKDCSIHQRAW